MYMPPNQFHDQNSRLAFQRQNNEKAVSKTCLDEGQKGNKNNVLRKSSSLSLFLSLPVCNLPPTLIMFLLQQVSRRELPRRELLRQLVCWGFFFYWKNWITFALEAFPSKAN